MKQRTRMRDLVILLPGITGSVLQRHGKDLWAPTWRSTWTFLQTMGDSLHHLQLVDDDPELDLLADGITATSIMPSATIVPGLVKLQGYTSLHRFVLNNFEVVQGRLDDDRPANYYHFPYDWRRDNRVAARQLRDLIDRKLPQWRDHTGQRDAKVILLAHSMGGLIGRYYAEALDGWRHCRLLVTFGTPHRGAVSALDYLANGYKRLLLDLTDVMRSFTSTYQLLPIYKAVRTDEGFWRVAELDGVPNVDRRRAEAGLTFHREIERAVADHSSESAYHRFLTVPMVGTQQPTLQQALLGPTTLQAMRDAPDNLDPLLADGDGTVPRVSAVPIELSDEYRELSLPQRHGSLVVSPAVLQLLRERMIQLQVRGSLRPVRGPEAVTLAQEQPAISLDVDDLYVQDEPVSIRVELINSSAERVFATLRRLDDGAPVTSRELLPTTDGWETSVTGLAAGLYWVEASVAGPGVHGPPVRDLFEVAPTGTNLEANGT